MYRLAVCMGGRTFGCQNHSENNMTVKPLGCCGYLGVIMTGCLVFRGLVDAGVFDEIEAARIWPHAKTDLVFGRSKVSGDQNFKLYLLERKMHKPPDKKKDPKTARGSRGQKLVTRSLGTNRARPHN